MLCCAVHQPQLLRAQGSGESAVTGRAITPSAPGRPSTDKPAPDASDIPRLISYQGSLMTREGLPIADGDYELKFKLYGDSAGFESVWEGSYTAHVQNGTFSVMLGQGVYELPEASVLDRPMWLGIQVNGAAELRPYAQLSASPYAINVANSAITTDKLRSGSVTADKIGADFIESISVNGKKVTSRRAQVNLVAGEGVQLRYDPVSNSIVLTGDKQGASTSGKPFDGTLATTTIAGDLVVKGNVTFGVSGSNHTFSFVGKSITDLNMASKRVRGIADPVDDSDAANKQWVLGQILSSSDGILLAPSSAQAKTSSNPLLWLNNTGSAPSFRFAQSGTTVAELTNAGDLTASSLTTGPITSGAITSAAITASGQISTTSKLIATGTGSRLGPSTTGVDAQLLTLNGATGGARELIVNGDATITGNVAMATASVNTLAVTTLAVGNMTTLSVGSLSGAGTNKYAGSLALTANQTSVHVDHTGATLNSTIIVTYQDLNHLGLLTAYVSDINPGVSFTVTLSGPVPEGANAKLHFMLVNP